MTNKCRRCAGIVSRRTMTDCFNFFGRPELLDAHSAALACGVSPKVWKAFHRAGCFPKATRPFNRLLWQRDVLERWLAVGAPCQRGKGGKR